MAGGRSGAAELTRPGVAAIEAMVGRIERRAVVFRGCVDLGRDVEVFPFVPDTLLLHLAELGGVFFALAAETPVLKLQVAQLLFVHEERVDLDKAGSQSGRFLIELISKLNAAQGVDAHFECVNAIKTPGVVGEQLDECALSSTEGPEFSEEIVHVIFVGFDIVGGKKDSTTRECGFDGVHGGFGFGFWTAER